MFEKIKPVILNKILNKKDKNVDPMFEVYKNLKRSPEEERFASNFYIQNGHIVDIRSVTDMEAETSHRKDIFGNIKVETTHTPIYSTHVKIQLSSDKVINHIFDGTPSINMNDVIKLFYLRSDIWSNDVDLIVVENLTKNKYFKYFSVGRNFFTNVIGAPFGFFLMAGFLNIFLYGIFDSFMPTFLVTIATSVMGLFNSIKNVYVNLDNGDEIKVSNERYEILKGVSSYFN